MAHTFQMLTAAFVLSASSLGSQNVAAHVLEREPVGVERASRRIEQRVSAIEGRLAAELGRVRRGGGAEAEAEALFTRIEHQLISMARENDGLEGSDSKRVATRLQGSYRRVRALRAMAMNLPPRSSDGRRPTSDSRGLSGAGAIGPAAIVTGFSGTVTDEASSMPLAFLDVDVFNIAGDYIETVTTNGSGDYEVALPGGTYFASTFNFDGYIDELYDDIACPGGAFGICFAPTGTPIVVTNGVETTNIDFALARGGFEGTIMEAGTGFGIAFPDVDVFNTAGDYVATFFGDSGGFYQAGLPPGTYYATSYNYDGFLDELYDNILCPGGGFGGCDPTTGTAIVVSAGTFVTGIDYALSAVGFSGIVTDEDSGFGVPYPGVHVFDAAGNLLFSAFGDFDGTYQAGVPAGTYFATTQNLDGYIDELYDDVPCPGGFSCDPTSGTAISVSNGVVTSGVDFALGAGGFEGTITVDATGFPIAFPDVDVFDDSGDFVATFFADVGGFYLAGLPPGTYYATTFNFDGFIDELYDDIPCPGGGFGACDITTGTPIVVSADSFVTGIDFELAAGGFSGRITDSASGLGIPFPDVQVFDASGNFVLIVFGYFDGTYEASLPAGSYFATTRNFDGYLDELYDNIACPGGGFYGCDPTSGTAITVSTGTTTTGIDFALNLAGFSGVVTDTDTSLALPFTNVQVFDSAGSFVLTAVTDAFGSYTVGVPPGTYYATTRNFDGYVDELYDDTLCPGGGFGGCNPTTGTSILVSTGIITSGVDFALDKSGFSGVVTALSTGQPIPSTLVSVFDSGGSFLTTFFADASGVYEAGLPPGTYYATTTNSAGFTDELYDDIACVGGGASGCGAPGVGTPIVVSPGSTTTGIDFALSLTAALDPIASPIVIGDTLILSGTGFTGGSVIRLFVATSSGPAAHGPFVPTSWSPTSLDWDIDPTIPLGNGFGTVLVVNTDEGYTVSNTESQLLYGDASDNIPTILSVNSVSLTPVDPSIPVANVETVVSQGASVVLTGTGFNSPLVNLFTADGNKGPIVPTSVTSTSMMVVVPLVAPTGPASFQVVNSPYTGNVLSNAVSAVIGSLVTVDGVSQAGTTVTVTGTGFSTLSVINFFNDQGAGGVPNLGGLDGSGNPRISLTFVDETMFSFTVPAGAQAGAAFVQVLNPPFIPYSSSGNDPDGAFTLSVP